VDAVPYKVPSVSAKAAQCADPCTIKRNKRSPVVEVVVVLPGPYTSAKRPQPSLPRASEPRTTTPSIITAEG
jgi:hypothetical protein